MRVGGECAEGRRGSNGRWRYLNLQYVGVTGRKARPPPGDDD